MTDWRTEIEELHAFFEDWIGGAVEATDEEFARLEASLADGFTFVPPSGEVMSREEIVGAVKRAHGSRPGLRIRIDDPRLLHEAGDCLVAAYREWQEAAGEGTERASTVVFRRDEAAPRDLTWLHAHETWVEGAGPG